MFTKGLVLSALVALAAAGSLRAQQPADAATTYARTCASCHGAKGTPSPTMAHSMAGLPDFADPHTLASVPDSVLRAIVANGKPPMMTAYKSRLTPEQISALVTYIKSLSRHQ